MDPLLKATTEYENESLEETLSFLKTSAAGLFETEAQSRLTMYGYNLISDKKKNPLLSFLARFWGPLPWLLELAMGISIALRHYPEAVIILTLLTANAALGQFHERGSRKALELLKKKSAGNAKVLRDGTWHIVKASTIVPGDVLAVKLGDIVPGDARILSGELSVDQSILTGESFPRKTSRSDLIFSSSTVKRGAARCVVVNTGSATSFGRTAGLIKTAKPRSHQEKLMLSIVRYMLYLGAAALAAVTIDAIAVGKDFLTILTLAVIFLLGAIPVALPAVLTIVQSFGALALSRRGAIVTRLASIEDAASMSILCLDKTGTLTQNKLSVVAAVPVSDYSLEDLVRTAALASRREGSEAIDLAIIDYARTTAVSLEGYRRSAYTPFDPSLKRTEAVIEAAGGSYRAIKGAAQTVLELCPRAAEATVKRFNDALEDSSRKGYRAIAVARSEGDDLRPMGLLLLADPIRPDSQSMIGKAKKLGIRPVMLTGDNLAIAVETARQVGIGGNIIRMRDITGLGEADQAALINRSDGLAEIFPEDKFTIVKRFQAAGHVVGMTGDGVNDAPALKQAETGLAVSDATDVAKAAASVVLTEPGLHAVIDTVKTSREIYQRMLTWVLNKIVKVIELVVLLTAGFFMFGEIVVSLLGMTLLIFANDFVTMSLATDTAAHTPNPNTWNIRKVALAAVVPGLLFAAEGLLVILAGLYFFHMDWDHLRAFVVLNLIFNSQFKVLILRERRHCWSSRPGRALLLLTALTLIAFSLLGVSGLLFPAFTVGQILFILGCSAVFAFAIDFPKYWIFKKLQL
jgi:H+-transporting ATPase